MLVSDLIHDLDIRFPFVAASSWDPVGLQLGGSERAAGRVGVCHEPNEDVVGTAIDAGLDVLVSYHPLLFAPTTSLVDGPTAEGRALRLAEAGISLIVVHTALDAASPGTGDFFLDALGMPVTEQWGTEDDASKAIGRLATLGEPMTVDALIDRIESVVGMRPSATRSSSEVVRVAVLPGSGSSFIEEAVPLADVLITGDVGHHRARDAADFGLTIIDVGHTATELAGIQALYAAVCDIAADAVFVGGDPTPWREED